LSSGTVVDHGEKLLREWEAMTGVRLMTCPWQAMRDPFVIAVLNEHRRWNKNRPSAPHGELPRALVEGIELYDAILQRVDNHDRQREQEERDRKNRTGRVPGSFSARPRRPSRRRR